MGAQGVTAVWAGLVSHPHLGKAKASPSEATGFQPAGKVRKRHAGDNFLHNIDSSRDIAVGARSI